MCHCVEAVQLQILHSADFQHFPVVLVIQRREVLESQHLNLSRMMWAFAREAESWDRWSSGHQARPLTMHRASAGGVILPTASQSLAGWMAIANPVELALHMIGGRSCIPGNGCAFQAWNHASPFLMQSSLVSVSNTVLKMQIRDMSSRVFCDLLYSGRPGIEKVTTGKEVYTKAGGVPFVSLRNYSPWGVGQSWRYCKTRPTRGEVGASSCSFPWFQKSV